jgi:uncharacterized protein (TIGR02147 family)
MIDVFNYFDYRKLIIDSIGKAGFSGSAMSLRSLAKKAGLDPSLFSKVLKGSRNISTENTMRIAEALGFDKKQTDYFELLVRFDHARGQDSKRFYFEKLLDLRKSPGTSPLTRDQYTFYSQWYFTVIRELLHFFPKADDFKAISKMLVPAIKPAQAREAVKLLEKLGIIRRNPGGGYELADLFITSGPELQGFAIRSFQASMMDIAKEALVKFPKDKREISTLTLSLSEEGFKEVIDAMAGFRSKLMEIAHNDRSISGVYQVNFQAFPVTRTFKRIGNDHP